MNQNRLIFANCLLLENEKKMKKTQFFLLKSKENKANIFIKNQSFFLT